MMTNRQYTQAVEDGQYPEDPSVPLDEPILTAPGAILNLLTEKFGHAAIITSQAGSVRANHYHKTDWHYAFVLAGQIEYFWRQVGAKGVSWHRKTFEAGTMFFTPPLIEHAMFFSHQTAFLTFAKNARSEHQTHESDLVRINFVVPVWHPIEGKWDRRVVIED